MADRLDLLLEASIANVLFLLQNTYDKKTCKIRIVTISNSFRNTKNSAIK